jgi:hypothetical protein
VWRTISVEHEYYGSAPIPVQLEASVDTLLLLQRQGILFRQTAWGRWTLLRPKYSALANENGVCQFAIFPTDEEWWYVTADDDEKQLGNFIVKKSNTFGIWRELLLPLKALEDEKNAEVNIVFGSKKKLWEFIFIPKFTPEATQLELRARNKELTFSAAEKVDFFKDFEAYRITSTQPVTLLKNAPHSLQLWEVRDSGDRLLSSAVPVPRCTEASVFDAKNAVTTYFYY